MGRCGRERASCESVVAYRRWCPPQERGGQASTHGCCGRLALSGQPISDVSRRRPRELQPVPAAFGAVEVEDLEPVGMRFNKWLPTRRVERNALDVAAAPFDTVRPLWSRSKKSGS